MRLTKSLLVGVLAATVTAVAAAAVFVAFSIGATTKSYSYADAGGGIGAESVSINLAVPFFLGVVAGVVGFFWQWRRGRPALG